MSESELRIVLKSLAALSEWIAADPLREREFCVTHDERFEAPYTVRITAKGNERIRGHSLVDAFAQAAQVILLNPELEP